MFQDNTDRINELKRELEQLVTRDINAAVLEVKKLMAAYGLTVKDLGPGNRKGMRVVRNGNTKAINDYLDANPTISRKDLLNWAEEHAIPYNTASTVYAKRLLEHGQVAQEVEQRIEGPCADGSIPSLTATPYGG